MFVVPHTLRSYFIWKTFAVLCTCKWLLIIIVYFAGGTHSRNDRASKHFYCVALQVSQGPTCLSGTVWRAVLVLRESEGTVQNAPFQTCASEEGCRNQVARHSLSLSLHLFLTVCH